MITILFSHALTFGLLSLAIAALWLPAKSPWHIQLGRRHNISIPLWQVLVMLAICFGLLYGTIDWLGLVSIFVFGIACYGSGSTKCPVPIRILAGITMFSLAIGLALHVVPGFSNPLVVTNIIISEGAIPFSKYLNFDKAIVGLFILGFAFNDRLSDLAAWKRMFKQSIPITLLTITAVLSMSLMMNFVDIEPKWSELFWLWAWTNLFFTCVAEEAIFRGVIQRYLVLGLSKYYPHGAIIGLILAAVTFGLAHFQGGISYILLATIAGLGYGWVYLRTQRVEASIICHFALNSIHFIFFTYPAIAP